MEKGDKGEGRNGGDPARDNDREDNHQDYDDKLFVQEWSELEKKITSYSLQLEARAIKHTAFQMQ